MESSTAEEIPKETSGILRVIIESPYAGNVELNERYLRACLRDSLLRGEAPYASHGLYTQEGVLDDLDADERECGMLAGFAWGDVAELRVFYIDLGMSNGMQRAKELGNLEMETRTLGGDWSDENLNGECPLFDQPGRMKVLAALLASVPVFFLLLQVLLMHRGL
jgi:hypothetical protein